MAATAERSGGIGELVRRFGRVPNGVGDVASFDSFAPSTTSSIRLDQPVVVGSIQSVNTDWQGALAVSDGTVIVSSQSGLNCDVLHSVRDAARLQLDVAANVHVDRAGELLVVNDANASSSGDVSIRGSGHLTTGATGSCRDSFQYAGSIQLLDDACLIPMRLR